MPFFCGVHKKAGLAARFSLCSSRLYIIGIPDISSPGSRYLNELGLHEEDSSSLRSSQRLQPTNRSKVVRAFFWISQAFARKTGITGSKISINVLPPLLTGISRHLVSMRRLLVSTRCLLIPVGGGGETYITTLLHTTLSVFQHLRNKYYKLYCDEHIKQLGCEPDASLIKDYKDFNGISNNSNLL